MDPLDENRRLAARTSLMRTATWQSGSGANGLACGGLGLRVGNNLGAVKNSLDLHSSQAVCRGGVGKASARSASTMKRIIAALSTAAVASSATSAVQPNIVFVVADDLGWGDVGFTGVSDVRTPHIDKLAANGLRLDRYYGQPVCSPSRAAIHTGRLPLAYALQTYVIDPTGVDYGLDLNETTLPQLLRDRGGYDTHAVGKWVSLHAVRNVRGARSLTPPPHTHTKLPAPRRGTLGADPHLSRVQFISRLLQRRPGLFHA